MKTIFKTYFLAILHLLLCPTILAQCECGQDVTPPYFEGALQVMIDECDENPEPYELSVFDDCTEFPSTSRTPIVISEEYCGLTPLLTNTCDLSFPWNLLITNVSDGLGSFHALSFGFRNLGGGQARLAGLLQSSSDTSAYLEVNILLEGESTWSQLTANNPSNSYYSGCNSIGNLNESWIYYSIVSDNSYAVGRGTMEGTYLSISPYPTDQTERVQIGQGANTYNLLNGLWARCFMTGNVIHSSANLNFEINEVCQIAGDFSCCASELIEYKYNGVDGCGNLSTINQYVETRDNQLPIFETTSPAQEQLICDGYPIQAPTVFDICSDVTLNTFTTGNEYWYIASDECGNNGVVRTQIVVLPALGESCNYYGCTNPLAQTYNPNAIVDDGSCNFYPITAIAFVDNNFNGIFDSNELPLQGATINTSVQSIDFITDENGVAQFYIDRTSENNIISIDYSATGFIDPTTPEEIVMSGLNVSPVVYFGVVPSFNQDVPLYCNLVASTLPCESGEFELNLNLSNTFTNVIGGTIISIIIPPHCSLLATENLINQSGDTIYLETPSIAQGGTYSSKLFLSVDRASLIDEGANDITIISNITNFDIIEAHSFPLYCDNGGNALLVASPNNPNDILINQQKIFYHFIYTADVGVSDFALTILPTNTTIPFDAQSIASDKNFSIEISYSPLRYDLYFDDIFLEPGETISLTYSIDASEEPNNKLISERIQYIANGTYGSSNWVDRRIVDCRSYDVLYLSNLESCINSLEFYTESDFFTNFDWYIGDSLYLASSNSFTTLPNDTLQSILLVASNYLCRSETEIAIDTLYLSQTLAVNSSPTTFCEGESVNFIATTQSETVNWFVDDVFAATGFAFEAFESGVVRAEVPGNGPCPVINEQIVINEIALPVVDISFEGDNALCQDESISLELFSNQLEYTVYIDGVQSFENPIIVNSASTIMIEAENICGLDQDEESFTLENLPEVNLILNGDSSFCDGDFVNIDVTGVGELEVFSNNSLVNNIPFNVFQSTIIEANASNSCGVVSENIEITVYPNPSGDFIYNSQDQTVTAQDAGQYQWLLNGLPIEGANSQTYTITQTGPYSLQVISPFGCEATSNTEFINYINVLESMDSHFNVYPNPADETITVQVSNGSSTSQIDIYNSLGQLVYSGLIYPDSKLNIDVLDWPVGVYSAVHNNASRTILIR